MWNWTLKKNAALCQNQKYTNYISSGITINYMTLSLVMAGEPGKRHNVRAHNTHDVFELLNQLSLGTTSASVYIENVA